MTGQLRTRPAQHDDLQELLDLHRHLDPQDTRWPPDEAVGIFE